MCFLHGSWPWARGHQSSILTAGHEGTIKICTMDGRVLHSFHTGHSVNTVCPTPESYNHSADDGFCSKFTFVTEALLPKLAFKLQQICIFCTVKASICLYYAFKDIF